MKVQVYSLEAGNIVWEPDGFVSLDDDTLVINGVTSERTKGRLNLFLKGHQGDVDKEAFLHSLISVLHVPFCRFGGIIDENIDANKKVEENETEGISDTDDTEETE